MWCVEHRLVVGLQRDDGTIVRANPLVIRRGDFVDVAVTVQIFTMRARKIRKTEIFFSPHEVVRVAPAAQITVRADLAASLLRSCAHDHLLDSVCSGLCPFLRHAQSPSGSRQSPCLGSSSRRRSLWRSRLPVYRNVPRSYSHCSLEMRRSHLQCRSLCHSVAT